MYKDGLGVPQDLRIALYWYRGAAEQGDAVAREMARSLGKQPEEER